MKLDSNRSSLKVQKFEEGLRSRIIGQPQVVKELTDIFKLSTAGLQSGTKPLGNLLLLGPTGVGKSSSVEAMAQVLYDNPFAMLKVDCAEFQHGHEIAKLIGSPPGYLGHRETHPFFTQETLDFYHNAHHQISLVLFDEIEKASDTLWKLLLGILDKAVLTLGDNRRVNFNRSLIFMTSNLGAREMGELVASHLGFAPVKAAGEVERKIDTVALNAAKRKFSPEFMNRIDKSIVFHPLKPEHLEKILDIELGNLQNRIFKAAGTNDKPFVFTVSAEVKRQLLEEGFDQKSGARELKRVLERRLMMPFANLLATEQLSLGDLVKVEMGTEGEFEFDHEREGAMMPILKELKDNPKKFQIEGFDELSPRLHAVSRAFGIHTGGLNKF
jgi:ATP-dependent Clp protease ATP-binding subunit ClpA